MTIIELLLISFGVAVDAFAVSTSGSLCKPFIPRRIRALNAALFFGIFQFVMPVIGFFVAKYAVRFVQAVDHYIAFALLVFVGGKMIIEALRERETPDVCDPNAKNDFFSPRNLFIPAIATSLDALAVGAGFAFSNRPLWLPAATMGIITAAASAFGVYLGSKLRSIVPQYLLSLAGGIAIVIIGIKFLFS